MRINAWPFFTLAPGSTKISETMPPSRFCTICTLPEGITCPCPTVTSSMVARPAHTTATIRNATVLHRIQWASGRAPCNAAMLGSVTNSLSSSRKSKARSMRESGPRPAGCEDAIRTGFGALTAAPGNSSCSAGSGTDPSSGERREHLIAGPIRHDATAFEHDHAIDQGQQRRAMRDQ